MTEREKKEGIQKIVKMVHNRIVEGVDPQIAREEGRLSAIDFLKRD